MVTNITPELPIAIDRTKVACEFASCTPIERPFGKAYNAATEDLTMSNSDEDFSYLHGPIWSKAEKAIARTVFEVALERELHELIDETKRRAKRIEQPSELWDFEEYLSDRREEINRKYDYRYSQLTEVFGRLLYEGRISPGQLSGLREDKLERIRSVAEYLTKDAAGFFKSMRPEPDLER